MVAHCRAEAPLEACGVLAGRDGLAERHVPMRNAAQSRSRYEMDPGEQLAVWLDMDRRGEQPVVIYHSHPATEAYPSAPDVRYAAEPDAHYVIVSLRADEPEVRSYRITAGNVEEEPVEVLDFSPLAMPAAVAPASELERHIADAARVAVAHMQQARHEPTELTGRALYCRAADGPAVMTRVAVGAMPDLPIRYSPLVPPGTAVVVHHDALNAALRPDPVPWRWVG
jgi:proteasome lid subunit RPN8/RPN11